MPRKKEYGPELAVRSSVTFSPILRRRFVAEMARRGRRNFSQAIQAAMQLWLQVETGKHVPEAPYYRVNGRTASGHIHLVLPDDIHRALQLFAARDGRSVPAAIREGIAMLVQKYGNLPEFVNLEEWKFLPNPEPTTSEPPEKVEPN